MTLKERLNLSAEPLFLVDGSSYIYRGFYAYPDLARSDGFPTNAMFIVLRIMLKVLREENPKYLAFILDGPGKNFRHEAFEEYKAKRLAMPEGLKAQMEPLKEGLTLMGLTTHTSEGIEADDCIASLAARYRKERPVVIMGSDKDLKQCLHQNVWLWDPGGKAEKLVSLDDFRKETGLEPGSWPDFQALIGDTSDNIPGVPGIGPKTAEKIMEGRPTLEAVRDGFDRLPKAAKKKLADHLDDIFVYRTLTRLKTDACLDLDLDGLERGPLEARALTEYLKKYEFRSFARELTQWMEESGAAVRGSAEAQEQLSLLGNSGGARKPAAQEAVQIASADKLPDLAGNHLGLAPSKNGMAIGLDGVDYLYTGDTPSLAKAVAKAEKAGVPSLKELLAADEAWGDVPLSVWFDLGLAAYLLSPEERDYSFDKVLRNLRGDPDVDMAPGAGPGAAADALGVGLARKLETAGLATLMRELEMPLIPVLVEMERAGIRLDKKAFSQFLDEVSSKIDELTREIYALAEGPFNIRSSQQLAEILFTRLGLSPKGKTPGGAPSTSQSVLEKLAGEHEIIEKILEYRSLEKLRSTYLSPLPKLMDPQGRVHTTFNQLATATGRLSSSGPNLQNIPIRGPMGARMRACFIAGPGNLLAAADYSQIELRLLADFSGDANLVEAFQKGEDIHARTAALLMGKEPDQISPDERRNAKTVNFGLLYGMGPQRLARELKITMNEAKEFISRYFEALSDIKKFYESVTESAKESGFVTTIMGRRRLLPDINSANQNLAAQAARQAINARVQGSAADVIKLAMIRVNADAKLKELGARLLLQVHDELVIEAPEKSAREAGERLSLLMSTVMDDVHKLEVPLSVDMGVGRTWAEAH